MICILLENFNIFPAPLDGAVAVPFLQVADPLNIESFPSLHKTTSYSYLSPSRCPFNTKYFIRSQVFSKSVANLLVEHPSARLEAVLGMTGWRGRGRRTESTTGLYTGAPKPLSATPLLPPKEFSSSALFTKYKSIHR